MKTVPGLAVAATLAAVVALAGTLLGPPASATEAREDPAVPRTVLDVRDLAQGDPPGVAWAERTPDRTVVHGLPGTSTPVPGTLSEFAPMGSGFVVQTRGARRTTTRWVAVDGTPGPRRWRTGDGLAVSPWGTAVAFSGAGGRVWSIDVGGDRVLSFAPVPITGRGRAVTISGNHCQEDETSTGCTIYVNGARGWYTSSHGIVDRVPHLRLVSTGHDRWLGGPTSVGDDGSCSAMLRSSRVRWRTCDHQLSDISSDAARVIGTPALADGLGPTALAVLTTSTGDVEARFVADRRGRSATYVDHVWEDDDHVLVVTFQAGRWALVRLGVDGTMEYAVAPRRGSVDDPAPFVLPSR